MKYIKKCKEFLKMLNVILNRKQKYMSVLVLCVIVLTGVLELLGISIIFPFLSVIINQEFIEENGYFKQLVDVFSFVNKDNIVICFLVIIIFIYGTKNCLVLLSNYIRLSYENQIQKEISDKMLRFYLYKPYGEIVNINTAEVLRGINNDVTGVYYTVQSVFNIISYIFTISLILIYLMITDIMTSIGAMVIAMVSIFILLCGMKKTIQTNGRIFNKSMYNSTKAATQAMGGIKEISTYRRNESFLEKYKLATEEQRKAQLKYRFLQSSPTPIIETVFVIGLMVIILYKISIGSDMKEMIPQLAVFAMAFIRIMPLVSNITANFTNIVYYKPSFFNAYNNMKNNVIVNDMYDMKEEERFVFKDKLEIKDVHWRYEEARENVLQGVNIEIVKGESIALIGESGSGKTTLADIILGLMKPNNGCVLADGINIYDMQNRWAKQIGYVPQNVYLLDDTIEANIVFEATKTVEKEKIWEILKKVQLEEFIRSLPEGLSTIVGERGVKLSGGQIQRIAIARALYMNPEIIVFDEATSALDTETEEAVMEAIESLHGSKTMIIIAHRLSTIRACDKIYKIENGRCLQKKYEEIVS